MTTETIVTTAEIETMTTGTPTKAKRPPKPEAAKIAKASATKAAKPKAKTDEISFREATKRRATYDALVRKEGCTLAQAHEFLKWHPNVCGSEFREVAKLVKRKLTRDEKGVYRLV